MTHSKNIKSAGKPLKGAEKALIMIHGRGGSAEDILSVASHLQVQDYTLIAPQANNNTWYPYSFLTPPEENEPGLSSAIKLLGGIEKDLNEQGISSDRIYFLGFSQGACLALEYVCRNAKKYGGVSAFTGGLIGDRIYPENYKGNFKYTPIFIGTSDPDTHVPVERVRATEEVLRNMDAEVTVKIYKNMGHTITQEELDAADNLIFTA